MHIICYREVHIRIVYDDDDDEYVVEMPLAVPTVQPSCQFGIEAISQLTWQVSASILDDDDMVGEDGYDDDMI